MTDTDLSRAMTGIADEAPEPPVDLLERVAVRHRRYRRRRAATAALAALAVLAAGAWGLTGPLGRRADTPATPGWAPLHVPPSVANAPRMELVWRTALSIAEPPARTPDDDPVRVVAQLDQLSLLAAGRDTFYTLDGWRLVYQPIVTDTGLDGTPPPARIAVAPHWIVWLAEGPGAGAYSVYRSPRGGASRELVAVVRPRATPRQLFATDDHVWWTAGSDVTRVSLGDGTVSTPAGFDGLVTDGTAWARTPGGTPTAFRNLVTGEQRPVVRGPGVASLRCVPAFCLGEDAGRPGSWFVQRPDGSGRVELRYPGTPVLIGPVGDGGLLVVAGRVLLDPVRGRFAVGPWDPAAGCPAQAGTLKDVVELRWGGGTCGDPGSIHLGADD
jgi:hypothetical protein